MGAICKARSGSWMIATSAQRTSRQMEGICRPDSSLVAAAALLAFLVGIGLALSFASQAVALGGFALLATGDALGLVHSAPKIMQSEPGSMHQRWMIPMAWLRLAATSDYSRRRGPFAETSVS